MYLITQKSFKIVKISQINAFLPNHIIKIRTITETDQCQFLITILRNNSNHRL